MLADAKGGPIRSTYVGTSHLTAASHLLTAPPVLSTYTSLKIPNDERQIIKMPLPMYAPEYLLKLNDILSRRIKPTRPSFSFHLKTS